MPRGSGKVKFTLQRWSLGGDVKMNHISLKKRGSEGFQAEKQPSGQL